MKKTKKAYEEYLNSISPPQGDAQWIIGGRIHMVYMWQNKFGAAIRRHDLTRFNVGFNEWKLIS